MTDINGNSTNALSNVAMNPLDKDLNISDYDIIGLSFGSSLRTIQSTQILQTSIINDSANKLLNVGDVVLGTTEMTGKLKVPNIATNSITNSVNANSSINMFDDQIDMHSTGNLYFNDKIVVCTPSVSQIESSSFKVTGGTSDSYMMSDGSLLKYSSNSGNSNYYLYKSHSNTPGAPPPSGFIVYDNVNQSNATNIYISHTTTDAYDIEVYFPFISSINEVYLQDKSNSSNFIKYGIVSTPTIFTGSYISIPVLVISSGGTGSSSFGNNADILMSIFTNSIEVDQRLSTLESKTINQTGINGVSTIFTGTNGVVSTKFVKSSNPNSNHFWKTDGSADSNIYVLDSDLINTNANVTTLQTKTQNLTSNTSTSTFTGTGGIVSDKFVTNTGTSLSFVKGDGSLDSTGYATLSLVNDVVNLINPVITKTQYQSISGGDTSFSTGLVLNGSVILNGASVLDVASIDRPYYGLQYQHNSSGVPAVQSSSLITAFGSTALNAAPWVKTNNYTRQYGCGLWTTTALADGAVCGYGGTVSTGAYVTMDLGSTFGLSYNLAIADSSYGANNCQNFFGLWWVQTAIPLNQSTQLSVQRNMLCFGSDTNDPNICIYSGGATTTTKWVDLGGYFPSNIEASGALTNFFKFCLYWDGTTVYYRADNTSFPSTVAGAHIRGQFTPLASQIPTASCTNQCVRIMGSPNTNGQAKLKVQRFGVF
jgi:hypothetical protein